MLRDFFFSGNSEFSVEEIDVEAELKAAADLDVPLPDRNLDFHKLARTLVKAAPRDSAGTRAELRAVTKAPRYDVQAKQAGASLDGAIKVTRWRLRMDNDWTVPAVEIESGAGIGTALLVADGGRRSAVGEARARLRQGRRVIALDPFNFGESRIETKDWLWSLLIAALGERPLGIQAAEIAAAARWARERHGHPVELHAAGPRTSLAALIAAALETDAIGGVRLEESFGSLAEIIERDLDARQAPELFCFGLLEAFELEDIRALVEPRPVEMDGP